MKRIKKSELRQIVLEEYRAIMNEGKSKKPSVNLQEMRRMQELAGIIKESYDDDNFEVHGFYTVSNAGGYEIMLSDDGESAKVRDAFGSDNPKTSEQLEIEFVPSDDDDTLDMEAVIDPKGYNIPLSQVMRAKR